MARFFVSGQQYAVRSCDLIANAPEYISTIGEVVGKSTYGNIVKTGDTTLQLSRICKVVSDEIGEPFVPQFRIGTRLSGGNSFS